jgi:CheY-like chemotaxis protein
VLVIDDEPLIRKYVERALAPEHDVTSEARAQDALARIASGARFDAIVCDVMMPEMTGTELYRQLAQHHPAQAERMVFITGGTFSGEAARVLEATKRPVVEKPFDSHRLRALVTKLIGGRATPRSARRNTPRRLSEK